MFTSKNLTRYIPEEPPYGHQAAYLRDSEGRDWYDIQNFFHKDTWKVGYMSDGIIVTAAKDVSAMFPEGLSISEVDRIPEGFRVDLTWEYKEGLISKIPIDYKKLNQDKKDSEIALARSKISDYQIFVDMDIADKDDIRNLKGWKTYFALIYKLNIDNPVWPIRPEII